MCFQKKLPFDYKPGGKTVVGKHSTTNIIYIHTNYFLFLKEKFGFESTPDILHAVIYDHAPFLKDTLHHYLQERLALKNQIVINDSPQLQVKATILKLIMNSAYGYSLLNINGDKFTSFKYVEQKTFNRQKNMGINIPNTNYYRVKQTKTQNTFPFIAQEIGSCILWQSKKIFFNCLYFLLYCLDPTKAMFLYSDTDSIHLCISECTLEECVNPNVFDYFINNRNTFLGDTSLCGTLIEEYTAKSAHYYAEKTYAIDKNIKAKSIPSFAHSLLNQEEKNLFYNAITPHPLFGLTCSVQRKSLNLLLIPRKRFFFSKNFSIPL